MIFPVDKQLAASAWISHARLDVDIFVSRVVHTSSSQAEGRRCPTMMLLLPSVHISCSGQIWLEFFRPCCWSGTMSSSLIVIHVEAPQVLIIVSAKEQS